MIILGHGRSSRRPPHCPRPAPAAQVKQYPGHARKVMHALWRLGQAMVTKVILVVDRDVNLRDYAEVAWKALNHIDPERDIEFVLGPVETLDHASRLPKYGSKMGVDAGNPPPIWPP